MNKIKYIILSCLLVPLLATTSCELDEYNPSGVTAEVVWSTPEGFQTVVNAVYSDQHAWYGKIDGIFLSETGTDLWFNQSKDSYSKEISKYENFLPTTGNFNKAQWPIQYKALNLCNAGINRIDDAGFTDEDTKNEKLGELRFMRAFYLWHIVETWGGVYLTTEETSGVILTATRSSVEEFYEVILDDLEFAVEHLPVDQGDEYTRASKKSAMGLLARMYITRAYYASDDETTAYFTKARDMAKEIIDNQAELGVELWEDYADMWDPNNNKQNKEALFVVGNSTNTSLNYDLNANRLHIWFTTSYSSKDGLALCLEYGYDNGRRFMPTLFLLDLFDETMDARYENSFQEAWYANDESSIPKWTASEVEKLGLPDSLVSTKKFEVGDTAMYITKKNIENEDDRFYITVDRDSIYNTSEDGSIRLGYDYPPLTKYFDPITREYNAKPGYLDIIIIRLSEIYLIAAEAEMQLGKNSDAAAYINVLRTRAAIKEPVDYTEEMQISADDVTLDFILDERARELCGEHIRWFDLKRTGKLLERVQKYNPDITEIQDYHALRPVPQTELDALLNGDEFGQNPGYE